MSRRCRVGDREVDPAPRRCLDAPRRPSVGRGRCWRTGRSCSSRRATLGRAGRAVVDRHRDQVSRGRRRTRSLSAVSCDHARAVRLPARPPRRGLTSSAVIFGRRGAGATPGSRPSWTRKAGGRRGVRWRRRRPARSCCSPSMCSRIAPSRSSTSVGLGMRVQRGALAGLDRVLDQQEAATGSWSRASQVCRSPP